MAQALSDAQGASLLLLMGGAAVVAWIASGRLARTRNWRPLVRHAFGYVAVLVGFAMAFFVGVVLLVLGSWPGVLIGGAAACVLIVFRTRIANGVPVAWSRYVSFMNRLLAPPPSRHRETLVRTVSLAQDMPPIMGFRHVSGALGETGPFEVSFRYVDANGNASDRRISALWFGQFKVDGYCHHRGSERSFRYDRIVGDVLNIETGELIPVMEWKAMCLDEAAS